MINIVLPPDLEQAVTHQAQQQGTSPELYLLNDLRLNSVDCWTAPKSIRSWARSCATG